MDLNPLRVFQNLKDWRERQREARRKAFEAGLAVSGEEYKADLIEDLVEAKKKGLSALISGLEEATRHDDGTEARRELLAAYQDDLVEMAKLTKAFFQPDSPEVRKEAVDGSFFDSTGSSASLPNEEPKALTSVENGKPSEPPTPEPKKRGRPAGVKNKPKSPKTEGNGAT